MPTPRRTVRSPQATPTQKSRRGHSAHAPAAVDVDDALGGISQEEDALDLDCVFGANADDNMMDYEEDGSTVTVRLSSSRSS